MTDWEHRQLFSKLDKLIENTSKILSLVCGEKKRIGIDLGSEDGDRCVEVALTPSEDVTARPPAESQKTLVARADRDRYNEYRSNGGNLKWNEWRKKDKSERAS